MGLDMFLTAKHYLGHRDEKIRNEIKNLVPEISKVKNSDYMYIEIEVGYWRKANQIHKWFVDRCQDGVDKCQHTYISREQLTQLKELCEKVLKEKSRAEELLSTEEGFFFGGTEYDECYFEDVESTVKILNNALELPDSVDFYYHSSW